MLAEMSALLSILVFAGCAAGGLSFLAGAYIGARRGKLYYEPSCPPVEFSASPSRFLLLLVLFIGLGVVLSYGAVHPRSAEYLRARKKPNSYQLRREASSARGEFLHTPGFARDSVQKTARVRRRSWASPALAAARRWEGKLRRLAVEFQRRKTEVHFDGDLLPEQVLRHSP